jgi:hypothetical protein
VAANAAQAPAAGEVAVLSLAAPWWLAGLALVPLMRWWHRGGRHRRVVPVAHLGLWQGAAAHAVAGGERRPPDPAWRRRALLAALLCIALAAPQLTRQQPPKITLWLDDSLSMLTREGEATRLETGMQRARAWLEQAGATQVQVRTLSDPWRALGPNLDEALRSAAAGAGQHEASAPPPALLAAERAHWLVTDGTKSALLRWAGGRRPDRIVQVNGVTRNVGLRRLSARRSTLDPARFDVMIELTNGGDQAETRELSVVADGLEVHRSSRRLEAGASARVVASTPAAAGLQARLQPGDALAEDDRIALDLAALRRRRVAVDAACAPPLVAAVAAHPALVPVGVGDAGAQAMLNCGTAAAATTVPTLRWRSDRMPLRASGSAQWASSVARSRRVALDADTLRLAARIDVRDADTVLLALGDEVAVVRRPGTPARIETAIDVDATHPAEHATLPLLVNLLFEELLGERLLDRVVEQDRGPAAARVTPEPGIGGDAHSGAQAPALGGDEGATRQDVTRALLLLALLVLVWELAALARRVLRAASPAGPGRRRASLP